MDNKIQINNYYCRYSVRNSTMMKIPQYLKICAVLLKIPHWRNSIIVIILREFRQHGKVPSRISKICAILLKIPHWRNFIIAIILWEFRQHGKVPSYLQKESLHKKLRHSSMAFHFSLFFRTLYVSVNGEQRSSLIAFKP
jgi:hypothetical protein